MFHPSIHVGSPGGPHENLPNQQAESIVLDATDQLPAVCGDFVCLFHDQRVIEEAHLDDIVPEKKFCCSLYHKELEFPHHQK